MDRIDSAVNRPACHAYGYGYGYGHDYDYRYRR